MADDYTEAILYKWGLESLVESFREADINREALAALSGHADIIAVLIPSIGKRVIFLKKLHELHQESEPIVIMDNIPVVATTSFATENVVDCVIEDVSSISSASTIRVESPAARDTPPKPRLLAQKNAFYVKRKTKDVIPYPTTIPELTYNLQVAHSRGDLERNGHLHLELVRMLSVHLLGITNGNPTPTDYSNYSLAVVDKYPFLGDGSEHRNVSVRLRLQRCRTNHVYEEKRTLAGKSRKTKNLKIVHKSAVVSIHECTTKPAELVEDPMSDMMKELKKKGAGGGPHIKLLLVQTAQERRKVVAAATTCSDILDIFPHLSNTEMLIFDFGLIQDISNTSDAFAEVSRKLKVIFGKEDDHFEFADLENMNLFVRLLSRLHPRTKKGSRPLLELAMAGQEFDLTSEAVQGPCMVVYFDEKTIISSALLCEGRVMCHSGALSTHQLLLVLLGSYFVMDRNFPSAYATEGIMLKNLDQKPPVVSTSVGSKVVVTAVDDKWEIPFDRLLQGDILGEGAFGVVRKGLLEGRTGDKQPLLEVAVKMVRDDPSLDELRQFLQEIEMMKSVGQHQNIVSIIGCCTHGPKVMLVTEFCALGDLQRYLKKEWDRLCNSKQERREVPNADKTFEEVKYAQLALSTKGSGYEFPENIAGTPTSANKPTLFVNRTYDLENARERRWENDVRLTTNDLLSFARQITLGMEFLAGNRVVHRDLAARNVLVCADQTVKISDFGLSRDIYEQNFYRKTCTGKLPIKWMAIESLLHQVYTTQSDVWSFGVLLWEIVTLGGNPYPSTQTNGVFKLLRAGYRMEQPTNCSKELYNIMLNCWELNPRDRPTFSQLRVHLDGLLESSISDQYLNLDLLVTNKSPQTSTSTVDHQSSSASARSRTQIRSGDSTAPVWDVQSGSDDDPPEYRFPMR